MRLILASVLAIQCCQATVKETPSWVSEVATRALPPYSGKVPAAILLDEQKVTVDPNGMVDTITRFAIKILTHEGKRDAEIVERYEKGGRQVKELHAWLVAPGGFVKTFEKNDVQDMGAYSDELYNDFRLRLIKADNAEIGAVFVYESEVLEKPTGTQGRFAFQTSLPSLESRYSVTIPSGWTATGLVLNHDPIAPTVDGSTYTWTLKDLPFREAEEAAPHLSGTGPLLAINFHPPSGISDVPEFKSWSDVSRWHTNLSASQADITPEMAAKVRELTNSAATEYDKVRALGHFVQQIRYVEIAMDLSHNGGYRPHSAEKVFTKQYGDCKDKANLLRALLKSAGMSSYLVAIYSGDRTFVKKEWASPWQFNHMILAIQVSDAVKAPTVISTPVGRLLLFDPTDYLTPVGDLPYYEQGSYALICAGDKGDLAQMPVIAPEQNVFSQTVQATLEPSGKLTASVEFQSSGQAARNERLKHNVPPETYKAEMERYLNVYAKAAAIQKIEAEDVFEQNKFISKLEFESPAYAQMMQNRLLVFNPTVIEPSVRHFPAEKERHESIVLNGRVYRKQVIVKLPDGFAVDEMPSPFKAEAPFAKFTISYRNEAGHILVDEELRTQAVTLPAGDYPQVKKFFDNVLGANNQKAVLVKN